MFSLIYMRRHIKKTHDTGSLKDMPYNERLQILGLWSLEERRICSDLIEMYKITNKWSNVNFEIFFEFVIRNLRVGLSSDVLGY